MLNITQELAAFSLKPLCKVLPDDAQRIARLCLQDWAVCALAGVGEPVSDCVRALCEMEGGHRVSTILGFPLRGAARMAALVNGTVSHALDYDDTHFGYVGHPSVVVYPAALAIGEQFDRSAFALLQVLLEFP